MDLPTIFYYSDNFCNLFEKEFEIKVLPTEIARTKNEFCLTPGEVMARVKLWQLLCIIIVQDIKHSKIITRAAMN